MLVPVKQHIPCRLDAGETITFSLEDLMNIPSVLFPRLFFLNTATASNVRVVVRQRFNVGPSSDPMLSANFSSVLHDSVLDPNGDRVKVDLETIAVDDVLDKHTVEITNQGLVEEIVHVWFEGLYEESMAETPIIPPTIL